MNTQNEGFVKNNIINQSPYGEIHPLQLLPHQEYDNPKPTELPIQAFHILE